jgi:hypothetical protein
VGPLLAPPVVCQLRMAVSQRRTVRAKRPILGTSPESAHAYSSSRVSRAVDGGGADSRYHGGHGIYRNEFVHGSLCPQHVLRLMSGAADHS